MTQIIAISGKKNAGKSTIAKYLLVRQLKKVGVINNFSISEDGIVTVEVFDLDGGTLIGEVDFTRIDDAFLNELYMNVWPHGRITSNAEGLKRFLVDVMEVDPKIIYGSDEDKLQPTQYTWRQMPIPPGKRSVAKPEDTLLDDYVSGRNIMQYWGQLFRNIDPLFHVKKVETVLTLLGPKQAYIDDLRYLNELEHYAAAGAKIIRLTRGEVGDEHESETELDSVDFAALDYAAVIDNKELTVAETLELVEKQMEVWEL